MRTSRQWRHFFIRGLVCVGAAALAIAAAVLALGAFASIVEAVRAGGVGPTPHPFRAAGEDAVGAFYLSQLVGVSFFNHTGDLRFAALPGLVLVGLPVAAVSASVVRLAPGSARARARLGLSISVAFALFAGLGAVLVPMHVTVRGFGERIAIAPSPVESFVLPLTWALLFSSFGVLVGLYGRRSRSEAARLLGGWAAPLSLTLRVAAAGLAASGLVTVIGAFALFGEQTRSLAFGSLIGALGTAAIALPALAMTVFLAAFGVSSDWSVSALSQGHGSISAFGGPLPTTAAYSTGSVPTVVAFLPVLGLAIVLSLGWLASRRAGRDVRRGLMDALRAAVLLTGFVWLIGLFARVDAQVGGMLGFHFAPGAGSLLWHVPLLAFLGCGLGATARALAGGAASRRALLEVLGEAATNLRAGLGGRSLDPARHGAIGRATSGLAFAAVPAMVLAMGPIGNAASTPTPPRINFAPIAKAAESELDEDSTASVSVAVNPSTRALGSANVHIPVTAAGGSAAEPAATKARTVLAKYGELFGLSSRPSELGRSRVTTDSLGMTHVYFDQMADGVPVFGSRVGVHFAPGGAYVASMNASVVPDLGAGVSEAKLTSQEALARARQALPAGNLVKAPELQVYAGVGPRISGSGARLAWFVWLADERRQASNEYVIDALDGKVLGVLPKVTTARNRLVYNANHTGSLPGTLARSEGGAPTGDTDVDNAYEFTGDVYNYYKEWFGRDSFNNAGASLISTAHYGTGYHNAFWNGQQMVFGDNYASSLDVVGHELTHAVTESTANLVYSYQSGALNESFSDIMGESVEYFTKGKNDWLIGTGLPIGPIRNLKEPRKFEEEPGWPDPESLSEWWPGCEDNYGVHINSTITSHAYYLIATAIGIPQAAQIFYRDLTVYLNPQSGLEDARNGAIQAAADLYGSGSKQYNQTVAGFNAVGLNGTSQPPEPNCEFSFECSFLTGIKTAEEADVVSPSDAAEMLETLYRARGQLAQGSTSGGYFMPLYEEHMGRITELVSEDPTLAEMTAEGLQEVTPALDALIEGDGQEFELSTELMERIEAALKRLAEDDRLYSGEDAGELADLIEEELGWMDLPSYGGMSYAAGFQRLNTEAESMTLEEGSTIVDPNCTGHPYTNAFQLNGFYVDTPDHYIPGQISPLNSGGVACGTEVEKAGSITSGTCTGKGSLNTKISVTLPAGDKVNSTAGFANGSWVGEAIGRAIACDGSESRIVYGGAALRSLKTWTASQCPTAAIACYEATATYSGTTGHGYSYVTESGGKLTLTTVPVTVVKEGVTVLVGFGEFGVDLCAHAGEPSTKACGGPSQPWLHQNGEVGAPNCPTTKGLYTAQATDQVGSTTLVARSCVNFDAGAHAQLIEAGTSLNSIYCIPSSTTCIAAGAKGNAMYSTNVSATAAATWTPWAGPTGISPAEAIACPATSLCVLADGSVAGGGGNVYRASSLGGSFLTSFTPGNGVNAVSCPTTSFCVATQEGEGFIRFSTKPSGTTWTPLSIGSGAMKGVSCLSASFCAVVDGSGNVHVATTEAGVKEAAGWKATNIDGTTALRGIACSSTTSCVAVDGSGELLKLTIAAGGAATVSKQKPEDATALTSVTCTGSTCAAIDQGGYAYTSTTGGASWTKSHGLGVGVQSASCASATLCAAVDSGGEAVAFIPE
jgi:Zn-dependent metalloprotease